MRFFRSGVVFSTGDFPRASFFPSVSESRRVARRWLGAVVALLMIGGGPLVHGAATPTTRQFMQHGSAYALANGDFVSCATAPGLDAPVNYYIEVVGGLAQLQVDIFDADVGFGANHDVAVGTYNSAATYTLFNPAGTQVAVITGDSTGPAGSDNAWLNLATVSTPTAGHWRLQVDMSSAVTTGDDVNAYGIRANDGDPTSGGTELNIYAESYIATGVTGGTTTITYLLYPYVVSGCEVDLNEFDGDSAGSFTMTSRTGSFSQTNAVSGATVWQNVTYTGWTTTEWAADYGLWNLEYTLNNPNSGTIYIGSYLAADASGAAPPPSSQPQPETFRVYLQTDAAGVPVKPFVTQTVSHVSGPNPPVGGSTTRVRVLVSVFNPSAQAITFSASNLVTANVPGSGAVYAGNASVTQGSIVSQPGVGGTGDITWNPGTVAANTTPTLAYNVDVTPPGISYFYDFESGASGWTTDSADGSPAINWELGDPATRAPLSGGNCSANCFGNGGPDDDHTASGTNCWGTDLDDLYANDIDTGVILYSPVYDFSGVTGVQISYWEWLEIERRTYDLARFQRRVGSGTWTTIYRNPDSTRADNAWSQYTHDASAYADNQASVQWRWIITTDTSWQWAGWYIDDVSITSGDAATVDVTGSGSNGTRATFLDETGNTSQARATFTFGPLCPLQLNAGDDLPTLALVSAFDASLRHGQAVVRWTTASEVGTIGFEVQRLDPVNGAWEQVNDTLVPGLLVTGLGGDYAFVDPSAEPGQDYIYRLVEVEPHGRRRIHGPFRLRIPAAERAGFAPGAAADELLAYGYQRRPAAVPAVAATTRVVQNPRPVPSTDKALPAERLKITTGAGGLCFIAAGEMADRLGLSATEVMARVDNLEFELSCQGQPVPYLPSAEPAGLLFYSQEAADPHAPHNVYWLSPGTGLAMDEVEASAPTAGPMTSVLAATFHFEEDRFPVPAFYRDPRADFWHWDYIVAGDARYGKKSFTVELPEIVPFGWATLDVQLKGVSDTNCGAGEHHVRVAVNGEVVGEGFWQGTEEYRLSLRFGSVRLRNGPNEIEVRGLLDTCASHSVFYVDSFDLTCQRVGHTTTDELVVQRYGADRCTVGGFTDPAILVLDVTRPAAPRWLAGVTVTAAADGHRVAFSPAALENRYLTVSPAGFRRPEALAGRPGPGALRDMAPAEYIVIAPPELADGAAAFADYRRFRGLTTAVVDLERIYDEFGHGLATPGAVREFLGFAWREWATPPRYVLLLGKGTFDYRDCQGRGDNLIPPLLVSTTHGLFPADHLLADVDGDDGRPEMIVGRIPAVTEAELADYLAKVTVFEGGQGDWRQNVLLLSDNPDDGGHFPADTDALADDIPAGHRIAHVSLEDVDAVTARQLTTYNLRVGVGFVNYLGHAAVDRLAQEGLLRSADVAQLDNGDRPPVLAAFTCVLGQFAIPGYRTLGEILVLQPEGGAVAVWSPSGLSRHPDALAMNRQLIRAIYQEHIPVLGDALQRMLTDYAAADGIREMMLIYNLLGDPALIIQ